MVEKRGCYQCRFFKEWTEYHPYGSTVAGEYFADCENPEMTEDEFDEVILPVESCSHFEKGEKGLLKTSQEIP